MKKIQLTAEEMVIIDRLKQMKMSGMAEAYEEQIRNPNSDLSGFYERFSSIVNFEWELRFNKKFNRFLKKATLRYPQASFDDTIYEPHRMLDTETIELLATCKWLDEGRNLLITGATGAGKSYISNALCIAAIRQFKTAKYIRANTRKTLFGIIISRGASLIYFTDQIINIRRLSLGNGHSKCSRKYFCHVIGTIINISPGCFSFICGSFPTIQDMLVQVV